MSGQFAMVITPSGAGAGDAGPRAELAIRMLSGPGLWLEWLAEMDRSSLLEELLADDVIRRASEQAPHGHAYERTLTAKMTVICVLVACLFPGEGYDGVLGTAFGLPGLHLKPGTQASAGSAFSKARAAGRAGDEAPVRAGRGPGRRGTGHQLLVEGTGDHRDRRHHRGPVQRRRADGTRSGCPPAGRNPSCGSWRTCAPAPAAGSLPRSAATRRGERPGR